MSSTSLTLNHFFSETQASISKHHAHEVIRKAGYAEYLYQIDDHDYEVICSGNRDGILKCVMTVVLLAALVTAAVVFFFVSREIIDSSKFVVRALSGVFTLMSVGWLTTMILECKFHVQIRNKEMTRTDVTQVISKISNKMLQEINAEQHRLNKLKAHF